MNLTPPSPKALLVTDRLYFREFTLADAPLLYALDLDPEVMRYISKGKPTPLDKIQHVILPQVLASYAHFPPRGVWAAHERTSNAFIGWFHLRPQRVPPYDMELGYRLHRAYWGRGYATEGSRALVNQGFTAWEVQRVIATTLLENRASQRVMQKCGLRFEKEFYYPQSLLPEWTKDERHAVQYGLNKAQFETDIG